jgi:hypothetical protein
MYEELADRNIIVSDNEIASKNFQMSNKSFFKVMYNKDLLILKKE